MKLKMPIKPLSDQELEDHNDTDIFGDARSWIINLFSFVHLDQNKFPKKEKRLLAEFSRDKEYL